MAQHQPSYNKPLPRMRGAVKEFYDWCKQGELRFVRCQGCGTWRHPPRPMCDKCGSLEWEWAKSSGKGKVYTWTVTYQPLHPGFAGDVPYAGVICGARGGAANCYLGIRCTA